MQLDTFATDRSSRVEDSQIVDTSTSRIAAALSNGRKQIFAGSTRLSAHCTLLMDLLVLFIHDICNALLFSILIEGD